MIYDKDKTIRITAIEISHPFFNTQTERADNEANLGLLYPISVGKTDTPKNNNNKTNSILRLGKP